MRLCRSLFTRCRSYFVVPQHYASTLRSQRRDKEWPKKMSRKTISRGFLRRRGTLDLGYHVVDTVEVLHEGHILRGDANLI